MKTDKIDIPKNSILGLNYSGMHDTSIAIISPKGEVVFASSLERVTRVKQDGRFPKALLERVPWDKIEKIAISNEKNYTTPSNNRSLTHPTILKEKSVVDRSHGNQYYEQIDSIKKEKVFFPHHLSHASSSFYPSGFEEALCLVYDGGMANEHWFGGVYKATKKDGIETIDLFSAESYSNITFLYSSITALLGFSPSKHEGKITGLSALGKSDAKCKKILTSWLENPRDIYGLFHWENMYGQQISPKLKVNSNALERIKKAIEPFSKEDIAATLQKITEEHIVQIFQNIKKLDISQTNICLSGGLFANVKLNQIIYEQGFKNIFIAPPMSDDGTALGAAWLALSQEKKTEIKIQDFYLGGDDDIEYFLKKKHDFIFEQPTYPEKFIAEKLSLGLICAIFQGKSEFGPRALGNRSILAQATQYDINNGLNKKLNRTEFMPFAPVIKDVDSKRYFEIDDGVKLATKFMTITVNCTKKAKEDCPAIVHADNTARPQIVEYKENPFIYNTLTEYSKITNKFALVNTSFNIHEEPIVNDYRDAIKGFFESGLDYLYMDGVIISLSQNHKVQMQYLQKKLKDKRENMSRREKVKKILVSIKLQINEIPILRNSVVYILKKFPTLYHRLQGLKPQQEIIIEEKVMFNSAQSEKIFKDIKNRME